MRTKFLVICLVITMTAVAPSALWAAEKLKFATSVRLSAPYYLTALAAEEKGFWQQNGLVGEWVPFRAGPPAMAALVSGDIKIGAVGGPIQLFPIVAMGVPIIAVSDLSLNPFLYWVRADSRFKGPKDLMGAKVAVSALRSSVHLVGLGAAKALGLERDLKFVGIGDLRAAIAALKAGSIDAAIYGFDQMAHLRVEGLLKEVINIDDYLPKPWVDLTISARKDFIKAQPDVARRVVRTALQSVGFVIKNRPWAVEKIKATTGASESTARMIYDFVQPRFTKDGRIDPKALENVRKFMLEYGLLEKDKAPKNEEIYTEELLP